MSVRLFEPLKDFEERLPNKPYCSNSKRIQFVRPKAEAKNFPYIQVNFPRIDYLCFDCDFGGAAARPIQMDIPGPTLTVITPDSGHAHLMYELFDPVPRKHSMATKMLLRDVIFAYKEMLCADRCITTQRQLVKNALSPEWEVLEGYKPFALSELAESIPEGLKKQNSFEMPTEPVTVKPFKETLQLHSRNCCLFENARLYAYVIVHSHSSYESLYQALLEYIEHLNDVEVPKYFPAKIRHLSELRCIARSIARWTFERRQQFVQVNTGAMGFPSMKGTRWQRKEYQDEVTRRRKLSAERTNTLRKEATRRKIIQAVYLCFKHNLDLKPDNISTLARVSRATVYRHMDLIAELGGEEP